MPFFNSNGKRKENTDRRERTDRVVGMTSFRFGEGQGAISPDGEWPARIPVKVHSPSPCKNHITPIEIPLRYELLQPQRRRSIGTEGQKLILERGGLLRLELYISRSVARRKFQMFSYYSTWSLQLKPVSEMLSKFEFKVTSLQAVTVVPLKFWDLLKAVPLDL
nr:PREDICTED: uncharacterized protein LOC109035804 [Bemisia tabaci]